MSSLSAKGRGLEVVHSNGRSWVGGVSRVFDGTHPDSLTKLYMRGLYCIRANRSSSRQQAVRPEPSGPGGMALDGSVLGGWLVSCLSRSKAGVFRTSMPGTRALNSPSSSPRFPYRPVSRLHSLYYSPSSLALSKHPVYTRPQTTDTPTPFIFQPQQQHQHYPTLTCPPQQRAVRHAILHHIQVLQRACRFARYTAPRTKRLRD